MTHFQLKNPDDRLGYLVWNQVDDYYQKYTIFNYFTDYYYIYLLIGITSILFILILKRNIITLPQYETIVLNPVPAVTPKNVEDVDIEPIITELIDNSSNLLQFKKLILSYQPQTTIIKGNRKQITKLITTLYNFAIRYSASNDNLSIIFIENGLSFTNDNFTYTTENLTALNDCLEIIKIHNYEYTFDHNNLLFKQIIKGATDETNPL